MSVVVNGLEYWNCLCFPNVLSYLTVCFYHFQRIQSFYPKFSHSKPLLLQEMASRLIHLLFFSSSLFKEHNAPWLQIQGVNYFSRLLFPLHFFLIRWLSAYVSFLYISAFFFFFFLFQLKLHFSLYGCRVAFLFISSLHLVLLL